MIVQPGVTVPGHADETGATAEGAQSLERLRMPATGGLCRDAVAVEHHDPARGGLRIRQAGRIVARRRARHFLGRYGLAFEGLGEAGQFDMPVHRLDGTDRHRQFQADDDSLVLMNFEPQRSHRGSSVLEQEDAVFFAGDVPEEFSRELERTLGVRPEDFRGGARPVERGAEDRQFVVTMDGADRRPREGGGDGLYAPIRLPQDVFVSVLRT